MRFPYQNNLKDLLPDNYVKDFNGRCCIVRDVGFSSFLALPISGPTITLPLFAIELTDEILTLLGFVMAQYNWHKDWLLLHPNLTTGTYDFIVYKPNTSTTHVTPLKYLHELQTFWKVHTKENLPIPDGIINPAV